MVTDTFLNNENVLIQNKKRRKVQKDKKLVSKQNCENADLHKPVGKNNDHTRIMRKIQFHSSFKT